MEMGGLFISYYFGAGGGGGGGGGILEGCVWFGLVWFGFFYNFCSAVFLRPALSKL